MSARVELLSRQDCHLCEDARVVVSQVCEQVDVVWSEVDVDADPVLRERYGDQVPVVLVDGEVVGYWRVAPERLRAALA